MSGGLDENLVEEGAMQALEALGYARIYGPDLAPGEPHEERSSYGDVVLEGRLYRQLEQLNPHLPPDALASVVRKLTTPDVSLILANRRIHEYIVDGVEVEIRTPDGEVRGERATVIDFENPEANDWLAVNQLTVQEAKKTRRADVVVYVNGLPLAVLELKNPAGEQTDVWSAYKQLQTYKSEIPSLFSTDALLVISDGIEARVGSLTAPRERFMVWRTVEGDEVVPPGTPMLDVLLRGVFEKERFLDLIRHFIVFEDDGKDVVKKVAAYHQFHATRQAVATTREAITEGGDGRAGVVWHTQGSGKSLTMLFYAGKLVRDPEFENPTLVVITDRNDLDDQLFGQFALGQHLIRQAPVQAKDRDHLRALLRVASGGVVFTTIQKFLPSGEEDDYPELSKRRNIVVIADEAHRSQYGFRGKLKEATGDIQYGFAKHMRDALPNASFIGFTGTPVEKDDRNTRLVFGDYIDVYDIQRAVEDGATVPIYYESRLAKLALAEDEKPRLDPAIEEVTEGMEETARERAKSKWAALEQLVGNSKRLKLIAKDIVEHFERRQEGLEGKGMVVCMSRRICVELYNEIVALRPDWHDEDDERGAIKVVMTGSAADGAEWQQHIRTKKGRERLASRFKDPEDPFRLVLVRDMWLTGFDAPSLHTMYVDKPMTGHNLMQAIARVNRVFRDKPGGLVVDYIGLASNLKAALQTYTESGGQGETTIDEAQAVGLLQEKLEICRGILHGFDYSAFFEGSPQDKLRLLAGGLEYVLQQDDGSDRMIQAVTELSKAYALCSSSDEAAELRDEVALFQALKAQLVKNTVTRHLPPQELEHAVRQLVSQAVVSDEVVDIFAAAGLEKPDISILSDHFLDEVRQLPQQNLALEVLRKLLNDEIKARRRTNVVQARSFAEMLEQSIRKYRNRAIQTAEVIEELIALAMELRDAQHRGQELGLSEDEVAFYDALAENDSAREVLGDETLRQIAREVAEKVRENATIDWTLKEGARAKMRVIVKRLLRHYGYPPDKETRATELVLEQAEGLATDATA